MSHKGTPGPEHYPSQEVGELLNLVSKGEEILAHAHAVGRAVRARLKQLVRGRPEAEDEPVPSVRPSPSAGLDARRSHRSTPADPHPMG